MSTSRKGLKRVGMRRYIVAGSDGRVLAIDKDAPSRWYVQPPDWPRNGFFAHRFKRLRDARAYAEQAIGQNDYWPDDMPKFLRRAKFERRAAA